MWMQKWKYVNTEAIARKVFLETAQNSQDSTGAGVSF